MTSFAQEPANEVIIETTAQNDMIGTTRFWVPETETDPDSGAPDALKTALAACTDGIVSKVSLVMRAQRSDPPDISALPDTPYASALDKAKIEFVASTGQVVTYDLPAILDTILQAGDSTKIDMADVDVKAFTDYVIANCSTADGIALTSASVRQGTRFRPSRRKNPLGRMS
jgi:hypothetical protein